MKFWIHMARLHLVMGWSRLLRLCGWTGPVTEPRLVPNPLLGFPRNDPCFCNGGKKFKNCHLKKLPRTILPSLAEETKQVLRAAGKI